MQFRLDFKLFLWYIQGSWQGKTCRAYVTKLRGQEPEGGSRETDREVVVREQLALLAVQDCDRFPGVSLGGPALRAIQDHHQGRVGLPAQSRPHQRAQGYESYW